MIYTTHYFKEDGTKWSGQHIEGICFAEAEYKASKLGLIVDGRLNAEIAQETGMRIDYDVIQNN